MVKAGGDREVIWKCIYLQLIPRPYQPSSVSDLEANACPMYLVSIALVKYLGLTHLFNCSIHYIACNLYSLLLSKT